jgi:hypothetical protein
LGQPLRPPVLRGWAYDTGAATALLVDHAVHQVSETDAARRPHLPSGAP